MKGRGEELKKCPEMKNIEESLLLMLWESKIMFSHVMKTITKI